MTPLIKSNPLSSYFYKLKDNFLKNKSKGLVTLAAIILTTGILGWLLFSQWEVLVSYEWSLRPQYLLIGLGVYSIVLVLTVYIWAKIVESLGKEIPYYQHFYSFCISALGKRLPGTLWYIAIRAQIYQGEFPMKIVTVASGIEMGVIIIAGIIVCSLFSIPFILEYQWSIAGIILLLIVSAIAIHPKFIRWVLTKVKVKNRDIQYKQLITWILGYVVVWILVGTLLFLISNFFTNTSIVYWNNFIGMMALTGVLSRLLLFSPSMFGFSEVSLSILLSTIMPSSIAVIIAISNRIITIIFEILWAIIAYLANKHLTKPSLNP
jgi:glycosyltransferase 2 family protein